MFDRFSTNVRWSFGIDFLMHARASNIASDINRFLICCVRSTFKGNTSDKFASTLAIHI